ncbi:MAG: hypothetical protein ABI430_00170 [Candidatus Taylorbacteria bacterium]
MTEIFPEEKNKNTVEEVENGIPAEFIKKGEEVKDKLKVVRDAEGPVLFFDLNKKYIDEMKVRLGGLNIYKYYLYYILIGSTPSNRLYPVKECDFPGDDSIEEFIRTRYERLTGKMN